MYCFRKGVLHRNLQEKIYVTLVIIQKGITSINSKTQTSLFSNMVKEEEKYES